MKQIQIARAMSAGGAVKIVKKLIGEVPGNLDFEEAPSEIETYARYVGCDVALELTSAGKLWVWSIKVMGV